MILSPWFFHKPCTDLSSRLALSPNGLSFHLSLITNEYHRLCLKRFLSWWYISRKLCKHLALTLTLFQNRKKWDSMGPTSPRSSNWCAQNDFWAYGKSTKTMHISCIKISTISKWSELSLEPHHLRVPSGVRNDFLSWWYVWRKLCTYLGPTLTLSPNRKKWDSTWPTLLRSSIGCIWNDFRANGTFNANPLASRLAPSPKGPETSFHLSLVT
jgi:hypothetical protein